MPKFKKNDKELSNHLDYWLYTLNNMNSLTSIPQTLKEDKLINQAFDVAEFIAMDKDEQFAYQRDLKARLDYKNAMDYAIECATEKGKFQEKLEIAKNLLKANVPLETISQTTNLDIKTIQNLEKEL
jgi:predicted transposase/invertase (TIGR01784 family)